MSYQFSQRSLDNLKGVNPLLVEVCHMALKYSKVDFGVIQGVRSLEEQKELYKMGASQTMNSKHLRGHAVDVMAYFKGRGTWELSLYDDIANAFAYASQQLKTPIVWGGAWTVGDIGSYGDTMERAMNAYVDLRRKQGRRPFIDAGHFELVL